MLDKLVKYVNTTDDHPLLIAAVVHYELVTIHPFEDGNGRTARLLSSYILDLYGYGFNGIGSLEEYFAYDVDEYYKSLQMKLPVLYYDGRNNPPHPEIWINYFLKMVLLYSNKVIRNINFLIFRLIDAHLVISNLFFTSISAALLILVLFQKTTYEPPIYTSFSMTTVNHPYP